MHLSWMLLAVMLAAGPVQAAEPPPAKAVAITLDDLPFTPGDGDIRAIAQITDRILGSLSRHGAPAVGFVNESKLHVAGEVDERIALLRRWVEAKVILGNHTFSHPKLHDTPLAVYQDDVIRGEVITRRLMEPRGPYPLWFRHPYTSTGSTRQIRESFEAFLEGRGYRVAPFTVENADYLFDAIHRDAQRRGDAVLADRTVRVYLDHTIGAFAFIEALSRETFGRDIPQVLLIHANGLNAACLDEMLGRLAARGYRFVPPEDALADPAYATPDGYVGSFGPSWVHRWRAGMGLESAIPREPDPPEWVVTEFRRVRNEERGAAGR